MIMLLLLFIGVIIMIMRTIFAVLFVVVVTSMIGERKGE